MDRQVAYVLTSKGNDHFSKMTRVSIASVRLSNPTFNIFLFCDEETGNALKTSGDLILTEIDEFRIIQTPPGQPVFKNRFIKTSLRLLIEGDFLFLDSDILVKDRIDCFLDSIEVFGAASNHSTPNIDQQIWQDDRNALSKMGWQINHDVYLNGGVLFYRDTSACRLLSETWHKNWLKTVSSGSFRDQPSLNHSVFSEQIVVTILPFSMNAQFGITPQSSVGATILHFYASNNSLLYTYFMQYVNELNNSMLVDVEKLKSIMSKDCPFLNDGIFSKIVVKDIYRQNRIFKYHEYAMQGKWGWALLSWIKKSFSVKAGLN